MSYLELISTISRDYLSAYHVIHGRFMIIKYLFGLVSLKLSVTFVFLLLELVLEL